MSDPLISWRVSYSTGDISGRGDFRSLGDAIRATVRLSERWRGKLDDCIYLCMVKDGKEGYASFWGNIDADAVRVECQIVWATEFPGKPIPKYIARLYGD